MSYQFQSAVTAQNMIYIVVFIVATYFMEKRRRELFVMQWRLQEESRQCKKLLHSLLPKSIAADLVRISLPTVYMLGKHRQKELSHEKNHFSLTIISDTNFCSEEQSRKSAGLQFSGVYSDVCGSQWIFEGCRYCASSHARVHIECNLRCFGRPDRLSGLQRRACVQSGQHRVIRILKKNS